MDAVVTGRIELGDAPRLQTLGAPFLLHKRHVLGQVVFHVEGRGGVLRVENGDNSGRHGCDVLTESAGRIM